MDITGILTTLIGSILSGGPQAIAAIMLLIIIALLWDRSRLHKEIQRRDEKVEKIIDEYYKGNLSLSEALNSLKVTLFEIKAKI